jgi:CheY-like chemotaxis protein
MLTTGAVLVVDDDVAATDIVRELIGAINPHLSTVAMQSGEEFIAYLEGENRPSDRTKPLDPILVLLDLNMPGMHGFDVLDWLRNHPRAKPLPVVVLTGSGEFELAQYVYALGARSFLTKPLRIKDLEKIMRNLRLWLDGEPVPIPQCAEVQASPATPESFHRELPQPRPPTREVVPDVILVKESMQLRRCGPGVLTASLSVPEQPQNECG